MKMSMRRFLLVSRRLVGWFLWAIMFMVIATIPYMMGIRTVSELNAWSRWFQAHAHSFLIWRFFLYAVTVCGGWWLHRRIRNREDSPEARMRLYRTEIAAVLAMAMLETSLFLQPR